MDKWKCADCLCICPEVYDGLEECKEICWMCSDCNGKVLENKGGEDKVLLMLEKLMDKICGLEQRLQQKVDVKKLEELESNMNKWLQQKADLKTLEELEGRIDQSIEEKLKEKADVKEMEEMCNRSYESLNKNEVRKATESSEGVWRRKEKLRRGRIM